MVTINNKPSKYELVIDASVELERELRDQFDAQGRGLGRLVASVGGELPRKLMKDLFYIAETRNAVIHDGRQLAGKERQRFADKAKASLRTLEQYAATSTYYKQRAVCAEWLETCPFQLDRTAKRQITIELRKLLDERPYATNAEVGGTRLQLEHVEA